MMLYTKKQLAEALQVSERKIEEDIKKGLPVKRLGKLLRFDYTDVIKWYENGSVR